MDCLDQTVILTRVILQLWHHYGPQIVILYCWGYKCNSSASSVTWCNNHFVFLPYKMTQSGGGFFSGEQQIFSSVILGFFSFLFQNVTKPLWRCFQTWRSAKWCQELCKATTQECLQTHRARIVTDRVRWWQQERPEGESKLVICLISISCPPSRNSPV